MSDKLFADNTNPCRIFFALVRTSARNGNLKENPFQFDRKWTVKTPSGQSFASRIENNHLQDEISQIKGMLVGLAQAQAALNAKAFAAERPIPGPSGSSPPSKKQKTGSAAKGKQLLRKGKGKSSSTESFVVLNPTPPPRRKSSLIQAAFSAAGKMFSSDEEIEDPDYSPEDDDEDHDSNHSSHESRQTSRSGPQRQVRDDPPAPTTETTYYIRKFELDLNGSPIDQLESVCTLEDAIPDFLRLFATNGQLNNLFTCGIKCIKVNHIFTFPINK